MMSRPIHGAAPAKVLRQVSIVLAWALSCATTPLWGQCSLVCKQNILVSLDPAGQAPISWQMIAPTAGNSCPGLLDLQLFDEHGASIPDDTLRCIHIGELITARVRHIVTGNSCNGTLQVRDALPPTLNCPEKTVFCTESTEPANTGTPGMTDNCTPGGSLDFNYIDNNLQFPCGATHNGYPIAGRVDRSWYVHDASNNASSCVEKIWVRQATVNDVTFPANVTLNCGQDPTDLDLTGQPTINGQPLVNSSACEVAANFTDQLVNYCPPAGYSVIRTWVLADFCNSTVAQKIQIVRVEDKKPPVLTPPANLTIGTLPFQCSATVILPTAKATDDCSTITISPTWDYGNGYGPWANVELGDHIVTYIATDACGNSSSKTMKLTVVDNTPPQAVCKGSIQLSLTSSGTTIISAAVLDDGSTDNCGQVSFGISRDEIEFSPTLLLTCADIGQPILLTLRVRDETGLENFCQVEASVRDFIKPTVQCPANLTLSCRQDPNDLQLTGKATASDNCALQSLDFTQVIQLNACNIGTVARVWKATDAYANTRACTQQITLQAVSTAIVAFPGNTSVAACGSAAATDPATTGQPIVIGESCYPLSITYTDEVFQTAPPSCFRILRKWKAIDFCIYDPNVGTAGYWQHTQIIDVRDNLPPAIQVPSDLTRSPELPNCMASVVLPDATATDCSANPTLSHNSAYASFPGANCSGLYPVGEHLVTFTASDGCGNQSQKTLRITVQDLTPPTAVCINGLSLNVPPNGSLIFQASALNGGSTDNCTPTNALNFATTPAGFNCLQLGPQAVTLRVTDASGNTNTCITQVTVQDNSLVCAGKYTLQGRIRSSMGQSIGESSVRLIGDQYLATTDCDTAGRFVFTDAPGNQSYTLRPHNNGQWLNGVSTYDLVLISKHILGLQSLPDVYHMIAADANHSNSITTFDIVLLRQLILGINDSIPTNTSWRFVPTDFMFADSLNPFAQGGFIEQISLTDLKSDSAHLDFVGIKIGDMNLSANTTDTRSPQDTVFLTAQNIAFAAGIPLTVPIQLEKWPELSGFQFEIAVDTALVSVEKVSFSNPQTLNEAHVALRVGGSGVAVSWDPSQGAVPTGETGLFHLHLLPKRSADLREAVFLSAKKLRPESYSIENQKIASIGLQIQDPTGKRSASFSVFSARPNPFRDATEIPFYLSGPAELTLTVADAQGRVIAHRMEAFPAGRSMLTVRREELPGEGLFFYRLQTDTGEMKSGKLWVE